MYAQAVRIPPRLRHRGGRRILSSASEQCAKGCAFPDVQLDCIKYLKLVDPAAGSGNFLTETYTSLRKLENQVIRELSGGQMTFGEFANPIKVAINNFYGIEINDFAVTVARTALWIAENQMMRETEDIIHMNLDFLPLTTNACIVEGNALRMDWEEVVPREKLHYIMGNPPFVGARLMGERQKEDVLSVFGEKYKNVGNLDYVCCWYKKAAAMMEGTDIRTALVSTNSVCQGETVANLWKPLFDGGVHIDFAYRTFRWDSEAKIKAHVVSLWNPDLECTYVVGEGGLRPIEERLSLQQGCRL